MEDAEGAPRGAGLRGVAVVQRNVRGPVVGHFPKVEGM